MKSNAADNKRTTFIDNYRKLPELIFHYKSEDSSSFNSLSDICLCLNGIVEYVESDTYHDAFKLLPHFKEFSKYIKETYKQRIFLVLKEKKTFSYTPNYIIKFIRGEGRAHGDSELEKNGIQDEKRWVLYNFVHEKDAKVHPELEFAITYNFIIYPGVKSSSGNSDSGNPFAHEIKIGDNILHLTAIESIVLSIALDFDNILFSGQLNWSGRVAITNDLHAFRESFGDKIVDALLSQEKWMLHDRK